MEMAQNHARKNEAIPSLNRTIDAKEVVGFDDDAMKQNKFDFEVVDSGNVDLQQNRRPSISISMPPSPNQQKTKRVSFVEIVGKNESPTISATRLQYSQQYEQERATGEGLVRVEDQRYNSFKTWSGKLERQISTLRGKPPPPGHAPRTDSLPDVDRYFDALQGPELETLRPSEEIILPDDKNWPFLLRYPISSFGICLGMSSQAIMWKSLASIQFLHISLKVNLILWCISVLLFAVVAVAYLLKLMFYLEAVRREYYHPIRVNFFFAPWIALLFLAIGLPPTVGTDIPEFVWYVLMAPIFILEVKIYGQWKSGGQRRLSKVANPVNHLSIVGNFVGALLGASMGLKEGPIFFFAVGVAHYTVLFVTLYQRLPTNETLPKELHPVFFLFVAAPSVASMAWARINGSFDYASRVFYFIAMFLYFSLAVRVNFFRGFQFSLAWWAYTFPMTGAAIATIRYTSEVSNTLTKILSITLSVIATLTVFGLLLTTILHAFVWRDLFPNDIAIAISHRKSNSTVQKWLHPSSENDIQHYLKFVTSNDNEVEVSLTPKDLETQTPLP